MPQTSTLEAGCLKAFDAAREGNLEADRAIATRRIFGHPLVSAKPASFYVF